MVCLADIFDQERAVGFLRAAWEAGRLPHAMIFAGPTGVGKATTARALAGLVLCERPDAGRPCGSCASCRVFPSGNHPDYHIITRQLIRFIPEKKNQVGKQLAVDVIRKFLIECANRKPAMGRARVFVVEEGDRMTEEAQNALLKTLEEPAGRAVIILLTEDELSLLPTIRSRCQIVRFGSLSQTRVCRELEKTGMDARSAEAAARFTEGSLGLARLWTDEGVIAHAITLQQRIEELIGGRGTVDPAIWFKAPVDDYLSRIEKRREADEDSETDAEQPDRDRTKVQVTREILGRYLRLAALVFRTKLAGATDDASRPALCSAIEALAEVDKYLDANVTISLILQQLAVRLEALFRHGVR